MHSLRFAATCFVCCALGLFGCRPAEIEQAQSIVIEPASLGPVTDDAKWPGWRGGSRQGVASTREVPTTWTAQENVRWRVDVPGSGNSSPVVWGDRLWLTSTVVGPAGNELTLLCFDRRDGRELWSQAIGPVQSPSHDRNGYASATVATDGRHVVVTGQCSHHAPRDEPRAIDVGSRQAHLAERDGYVTSSLGLTCYDIDGRRLWQQPLGEFEHQWGAASSPVLWQDRVIQLCDGERSASLMAFDLPTGRPLWRTSRASRGCWTTPVIIEHTGSAEAGAEVVVNGSGAADGSAGFLTSYDPHDGRELWRVQGTADIVCPTAIVTEIAADEPRLVISASGSNGPVFAVRLGGRGDLSATHVSWRLPHGGAYVPSGVVYEGRLYLVTDSGVASCYAAESGALVWRKRLQGTFSASLIAAGGHIYAVNERGETFVFAAGTDQFELVATNRLGEKCFATPAVAHGEIYLRTEQRLYCLRPAPVVAHAGAEETPVGEAPIASPSDQPSPLAIPQPTSLDQDRAP